MEITHAGLLDIKEGLLLKQSLNFIWYFWLAYYVQGMSDEWGMGIKFHPFIRMGMNNILVLSIHPHSSTFIGICQKVSTLLKTSNVAVTQLRLIVE